MPAARPGYAPHASTQPFKTPRAVELLRCFYGATPITVIGLFDVSNKIFAGHAGEHDRRHREHQNAMKQIYGD